MHYFIDCLTVFEIKKKFRELAMQHHPDMGGDNDTMREILEQYHQALSSVDGQKSTGNDGKEHTYYYNSDNEQAIADKIQALLRLRMDGVEIALVGTWIWVSGNTKPYSKKLGRKKDKDGNPMGLGLTFDWKKKMWHWKPYKSRRSRHNPGGFEAIKAKYGYKKYENNENEIV